MISMLSKRNLGLDLMRVFAIYFVLIDHGGKNPFGNVLLGGLGVEIFFVLSGFLIGRIIIREFRDFKGFETFRIFWVNRWFRTLPLYYLALIVQIILSKKIDWGYLYYFIFFQNNFYGISLYRISWSLVVEEWFYIGLPFVFFFFRLLFKKISISHLIGYVFLLIVVKILIITKLDLHFEGVNGNALLRFDSMLIGVILAMIHVNDYQLFKKLSGLGFFLFGLIFTVILQYLVFAHFGLANLRGLVFFNSLYFLLQSILIGLMLPFLSESEWVNRGWLNSFFFRDFITWTSILSYSFYLFHMNVFQFVHSFQLGKWSFIIALLLLYPFAFLLYHLYEKPATDLRRKFS